MSTYDGWPADACEAVSWPAKPISVQAASANKLLFQGRALLRGWSLQNGNAGAQVFQILDGSDQTGLVVAYLPLAAGAISQGPSCDTGIFLEIGAYLLAPAGPLNGVVYLTPVSGIRGEFGPESNRR